MVENKKRGRGRPRSFDENEALDQAIELFWAKGFDATSLDDLSGAMGIGRPSLYHAFGDKEGIFMRCLQRYASTICAEPMAALAGAGPVRDSIANYLTGVAEYATKDEAHLGCMLGAVACVVEEKSVREFVAGSIEFVNQAFVQRLRQAVETNELPPDFPVKRRARRAVNAMLAITTRARHGVPLSELLEDVEDGTSMVLA